MKKVLLVLSIAFITVSSCKKDDKACPKTMDSIAGTYKLVKVEQGAGGTYSDVTNDYTEACERDNTLALNAAGTWVYTDAGTTCSFDDSDNGIWTIDSNGKLNIGPVGSFILEDLTINSFDCSTLVAESDFGTVGGTPIKVRFTFNK